MRNYYFCPFSRSWKTIFEKLRIRIKVVRFFLLHRWHINQIIFTLLTLYLKKANAHIFANGCTTIVVVLMQFSQKILAPIAADGKGIGKVFEKKVSFLKQSSVQPQVFFRRQVKFSVKTLHFLLHGKKVMHDNCTFW